MKGLIILATTLFALCMPYLSVGQGQAEIHWMTLEEAVAAQAKSPKKIMMDVYTKWCGPCKMLDKNTFHNGAVASFVNKNYYAVKFDAEHPDPITFKGQVYTNPTYDPSRKGRNGVHQLSRYLAVNSYPTILFFDEELNIIAPITGYRTPPQLELFLKFFQSNDYKNVTTKEQWEAYQTGFTPTW